MFKTACSAILVFACVASVRAQESLLPTHISDTGEVTVTAMLRFNAGQGTLSDPLAEADFDLSSFFGEIRVGVGVGSGFEIEGSFPYAFSGTGEADEGGFGFEVENVGLGDLTVEGNYLLVPSSKTSPQVMAGLVVVLPMGNDDFATPEIRIGGVTVQQGDEGGIGDGVFKIGVQFGVSQKVTGAEIYGLARFVVSTGKQDDGDTEVDHPDVFTLVGGAMVPLGDTSNLDVRLTLNHRGDKVADDGFGSESTDESHLDLNLEARFYFTVGSTATLVLGAGAGWIQDHAVDEEASLDLEQAFTYGVGIGLHLSLGVPLVGGAKK
jgi:hypothetical protein